MTADELQRYLHHQLPLTRAMQVGVISVSSDGIVLSAPLQPNINHQKTVFGGSATTLAITAAWSLVHVLLKAEGIGCDLVIRRNTMEYERPMLGAFTARSHLADSEAWPAFMRMLLRKGRARIKVGAVLECEGQVTGRFEGEFVALR